MDNPEKVEVVPEPAVGKIVVHAPTITIRTNLWYNWARIAIEHEAEAVKHVRFLEENWTTPDVSRDILGEMHPSMVAVVASADAIDALHADIAPLLGREVPDRPAGKQWGHMLETFRTGYDEARHWQDTFEWLFEARGNAVHYRGASKAPEPHPSLPTNVAPENVLFSAQSAVRAIDILMQVFGAVLQGRTPVEDAAAWGEDRRHVLAELEARRSQRNLDKRGSHAEVAKAV